MATYSRKTIPLDALLDRLKIVDSGTALPDVTILRLPAAAKDNVFLHVGDGGEPIDLIEGMALHITPPELTGLYVTTTAPFAGLSLKLLIGYISGYTADSQQ